MKEKPVRASLALILFLLLTLSGGFKNLEAIVSEGHRGRPALDSLNAELKLHGLGLVLVDRPVYEAPEAADVEDALAGGPRAIIFGAPTGVHSELEQRTKAGSPILLYDQGRDSPARVFVRSGGWKACEFVGGAAMAGEDPADRDSF
jgi:hypothetical protein